MPPFEVWSKRLASPSTLAKIIGSLAAMQSNRRDGRVPRKNGRSLRGMIAASSEAKTAGMASPGWGPKNITFVSPFCFANSSHSCLRGPSPKKTNRTRSSLRPTSSAASNRPSKSYARPCNPVNPTTKWLPKLKSPRILYRCSAAPINFSGSTPLVTSSTRTFGMISRTYRTIFSVCPVIA